MLHIRLTVSGAVASAVAMGLIFSFLAWAEFGLQPEERVQMLTQYSGWILTAIFGAVALLLVSMFAGAAEDDRRAQVRYRQTSQYREAVVMLLQEALVEADDLLNRLTPEERREAVCAALMEVQAGIAGRMG